LNGAQHGGSVPKVINTVSDRLEQQREEVRFRVLRLIENNPEISQRELADELRGLIKVNNFIRSDNKLAYIYLLTPKGVADKLAITKRFLVRKRQEFEMLKTELEELEKEVDKQ
jgi:MarR family transcriptional regulator, temperature-dependent positive regulator of motility